MVNKKIVLALVGGVAFFVANTASAQSVGYVGAAFGESDVDVSGYDTPTSVKIFGGINMSQYLAFEAAYSNLGEFDDHLTAGRTLEVDGIEFTVVGNLPLAANVSIFGKAGFYSWNLDETRFGYKTGSADGTDLTYGFGVKLGLSAPLTFQLEYQRYEDITDANIDTFYAGLAYNF